MRAALAAALLALAGACASAACTNFTYTTPPNFLNNTALTAKASRVRFFTSGFSALTPSFISISTSQSSADVFVNISGSYDSSAFAFSYLFNFTYQAGVHNFDVWVTPSAISSSSRVQSSMTTSALALGAAAAGLGSGSKPMMALAGACALGALTSSVEAVTAACPVSVNVQIVMPANYTLVNEMGGGNPGSFYYTIAKITPGPTFSPSTPTAVPSFSPTRSPTTLPTKPTD